VNKLAMEPEVAGEPLRFILRNKASAGSAGDVVVACQSEQEKATWTRVVKQLLDTQLMFLNALHNPIAYQKELNREFAFPIFDPVSLNSIAEISESAMLFG